MHNVFNYASLYHAPGADATAIVSYMTSQYVKASLPSAAEPIRALLFHALDESSLQGLILDRDMQQSGLIALMDAASTGEMGSEDAYAEFFAMEMDAQLSAVRVNWLAAQTLTTIGGPWQFVHVQAEKAFPTPENPDNTEVFHVGVLAFAPCTNGALWIANLVSHPPLFPIEGAVRQLVAECVDDAYTYVVTGSETLTQIFLQTCSQPVHVQLEHMAVGYTTHESYYNNAAALRIYNLSFIQNASRGAGFGVTTTRLYRTLRKCWTNLTVSAPDLLKLPDTPYLPGVYVGLHEDLVRAVCESLDETIGRDFVDELESDAMFEFEYATLGVVVHPSTLQGVPLLENDTLTTLDASKLVMGAITYQLTGLSYADFVQFSDTAAARPEIATEFIAALRAAVPASYSNPRWRLQDATPNGVLIPLHFGEDSRKVNWVLQFNQIPPYIGLDVIPIIATCVTQQDSDDVFFPTEVFERSL